MLRLFVAILISCVVSTAAFAAKMPDAYYQVTQYSDDGMRVIGYVDTRKQVRRAAPAVRVVAAPASPSPKICKMARIIGRDVLTPLKKGVDKSLDLVDKTIQFFVDKGYSLAAAAGIAGHIKAESNFNTHVVGDGGMARGLAQWHPGRYKGVKKLAADRNTLATDFHTQLEYIDQELRTHERLAYERLMQAVTVLDATKAFAHFERPQGYTVQRPERSHNFHGRLRYANEYAKRFAHHEWRRYSQAELHP